MLWLVLAILLIGIAWAITSDNSFAQGLQELAGWKHDQVLLETPFSIAPHNFRYYKFVLPEGSVNVSIMGQFAVTSGDKKAAVVKPTEKSESNDSDIEVYVLNEAAFAVWQNGYTTSSVYESGRVAKGALETDLPAGAGVYYLIFSNKFSQNTAKNINATVLVHYKSWVPESLQKMKERFTNWVGA